MADGSVQGVTHDRYAAAREVFEANLANGEDVGASFCATVEGETVVDLWGGWADPGKTRPWTRDTIVNVYSTTKTMTALTALLIADRGELDFDAPVAKYWPEFAANGKAGVKVSHLMSHAAGLSGWKEKLVTEDLYDWGKVTSLLAAQAPYWEPGTAPGYHALTQGYLVGEVVRRITGKSLGTVFREEIAEPLGADFHIGLPASAGGGAISSATRASSEAGSPMWKSAPSGSAISVRNTSPMVRPVMRRTTSASRYPWVTRW